MTDPQLALGIDIGGTGIKAGVVDTASGKLVTDRLRLPTPKPAHPAELIAAVKELIEPFRGEGHFEAAGVGFPAVIKDGVALTATNISDKWLFADVANAMSEAVGQEVAVLNDADAAGLAEMRFGAGAGINGTVLVVTLGTGIGTSLFHDGHLVPNMELGRVEVRGKPAWERVPNSVREKKGLSWEAWAADVQTFLQEIDVIAWPELIILGGGVSAEAHRFLTAITVRPPVMPARLRNHAGIIGAAVFAVGEGQPLAGVGDVPQTTGEEPAA